MPGKTWQVSYGSVSISCRTEYDAKLLLVSWSKRGITFPQGHLTATTRSDL